MLIGYARISRGDHQDLAAQLRTLSEAGCEKVYDEEASGADAARPQLKELLARLEPGDVLIVWKLDRLSRSLSDLLLTLAKVEAAGAGFRSITEAIDTTTAAGRLMMHMIGAFAEFERAMIRERTMQGLETARRAGRHLGRKPKLKPSQKAEIVRMIEDGRGTPAHAAGLFNVSKATVKRVVAAHRLSGAPHE
ncbi:recombinase family protein [Caulobacter sp. NIBR2454]|uniref:recombinase family protein n=1 Tax=Caulobacter sp. NIBR2454 TaxID=3015996 RepID=UPI0022B6A1DC|nr:recombinase family protein [Caulobacter sp. NIBR2454]